jgi:hypothetical protein
MTAKKIYNKYDTAEFNAFLGHGENAKSKEQYLEWAGRWKTKYRELCGDITRVKGMRKQNKYQYRDPQDNTVQRRTIIGENSNHDSQAWLYVDYMGGAAYRMLSARNKARRASWVRKLAADAEREAA